MTEPAPTSASESGNTRLSHYNTFGVEAHCGKLLPLTAPEQLSGLAFDPDRDLIIGDGSNILIVDDVPGTVILNRLAGRRVLEQQKEATLVYAGAGEDWHEFVLWTLEQKLSGLENLSLIPGRVGAAPIQNIGAYGVELAERLVAVQAWDWKKGIHCRLENTACAFAYRDSRFKSEEPNRFLITGLELRLDREFKPRLDYAGLRTSLDAAGVRTPSARDVSDAVIQLRQSKLPDPEEIGNAGSFFKNPIVDNATAKRLEKAWPALPLHPTNDGRHKASAAWMIEHCGWKGRRDGDAGVSPRHALVLVNHGSATGHELESLARRIRQDVQAHFGVALEPEPRIIRFSER